jgi:hypothetical protein
MLVVLYDPSLRFCMGGFPFEHHRYRIPFYRFAFVGVSVKRLMTRGYARIVPGRNFSARHDRLGTDATEMALKLGVLAF